MRFYDWADAMSAANNSARVSGFRFRVSSVMAYGSFEGPYRVWYVRSTGKRL